MPRRTALPDEAAVALLKGAYDAFNSRRIDALLAAMHPDVVWPNGWEGGYVHGHQGVRDYWVRQWAVVDPRVVPLNFEAETDGRIAVRVHQLVQDRGGRTIMDTTVSHVYRLEDGLVMTMEIRAEARPGVRRGGGEA